MEEVGALAECTRRALDRLLPTRSQWAISLGSSSISPLHRFHFPCPTHGREVGSSHRANVRRSSAFTRPSCIICGLHLLGYLISLTTPCPIPCQHLAVMPTASFILYPGEKHHHVSNQSTPLNVSLNSISPGPQQIVEGLSRSTICLPTHLPNHNPTPSMGQQIPTWSLFQYPIDRRSPPPTPASQSTPWGFPCCRSPPTTHQVRRALYIGLYNLKIKPTAHPAAAYSM